MRNILFRGKSKKTNEYLYGGVLISDGCSFILPKNVDMETDAFKQEVDPITVDQYIGLKDKKGKMIFNHDTIFYKGNRHKIVFQYGAYGYLIRIQNKILFTTFVGGMPIINNVCTEAELYTIQ